MIDPTPYPTDTGGLHVLCVDDNVDAADSLGDFLELLGYEVTVAHDAAAAALAAVAAGARPQACVLDITMPLLNGIDAASMWRQIEGGRRHLPIIGVTADATTETEVRCLAAGMDIRVTKPFDANHLLTLIEQYTEGTSANNSAQACSDPFSVVVPIAPQLEIKNLAIDSTQLEYLYSIGDQSFVDDMISSFHADIDETVETMRKSAYPLRR